MQLEGVAHVSVVGRWRGHVLDVRSAEHTGGGAPPSVHEQFELGPAVGVAGPAPSRTVSFEQPEGAFSNPNAFVARQTLLWLCSECERLSEADRTADLL
jgi:hypothetical protein